MTEDGVCPGCGLCSGMSLAPTITGPCWGQLALGSKHIEVVRGTHVTLFQHGRLHQRESAPPSVLADDATDCPKEKIEH